MRKIITHTDLEELTFFRELMLQKKQIEWHTQWTMLQDDELFLFKDWIFPVTLEDFRENEVLECGCGGGQHTSFVAPYAKHHTAIDLNTIDIAQQRNINATNVTFLESDITSMDLNKQFDIVFSIGVLHHTDDPNAAFKNMAKHTKSGGKTIVWVYSKEGNVLVEYIVEPIRKLFLRHLSRTTLLKISKVITGMLYFFVYTIYCLPLKFLPFFEYFGNFRKLSFARNCLNVFDKLNAPQVAFISYDRIKKWFIENGYEKINITSYMGVSWRGSGVKK